MQLSLSENQEDDRTVTVMGILTTLGSVLDMVEDNQDVLYHIEEQVRRVIKSVLDHEQIGYLFYCILKAITLFSHYFLLLDFFALAEGVFNRCSKKAFLIIVCTSASNRSGKQGSMNNEKRIAASCIVRISRCDLLQITMKKF